MISDNCKDNRQHCAVMVRASQDHGLTIIESS